MACAVLDPHLLRHEKSNVWILKSLPVKIAMILRRPRVPNVPRDTRERRELRCCDRNSPHAAGDAGSNGQLSAPRQGDDDARGSGDDDLVARRAVTSVQPSLDAAGGGGEAVPAATGASPSAAPPRAARE